MNTHISLAHRLPYVLPLRNSNFYVRFFEQSKIKEYLKKKKITLFLEDAGGAAEPNVGTVGDEGSGRIRNRYLFGGLRDDAFYL